MKIGLVLSKTPEYSETFFLSKIKGLQNSGIDLTLFVQKKSPDFVLCKVVEAPTVFKENMLFQFANSFVVVIKILKYPKRLLKFIQLEKKENRSFKQCLKNLYNNSHILKANLDWLHFGFATMALQSENVAEAIGAKMAVSFRGFDLDVYPIRHPNCYELLFKNVDKVHAISKYMLDKGYQLGLLKHTPFKIITPAIDTLKFKRSAHVSAKDLHILTIARLHWIKGLDHTLRAMEILKDNGIDFKYSIVGEGSEQDHLHSMIHKLNLSEHVTLEGRKEHKDVLKFLDQASLYIQYSDSEGFCNAVLEAQAMGLLCVVSDGGALPENIVDKRTGWIVPRRSPEALAKAIQEILNLPEDLKAQIREKAQQRVASKFNLDKQRKEFVEFYS